MTTSACQLYLVMSASTPQAMAKLATALVGGRIACLLLTGDNDGNYDPAVTRPLVKLAQSKGVATLIEDDIAGAKMLGADGVHLRQDPFSYDEARRTLGPKAIVGVDVGLSRHDAMELGERGADYVAFSESDFDEEFTPPLRAGDEPGEDMDVLDEVGLPLPDRIAWWAELFTVPCVAWDVILPEEAEELAALGADFVAIAPEAWLDAVNPGPVIDTFADAVGRARVHT